MASTYTTNLGIEKIGTGEQSGTWGDTTNTNFDILDEAVNGIISITLSSAGSSGSPNSLPITDGASSNGRNKFIEFVDGGDLGGTAYVQLTPNDAEKIVHIRNSLSSSRSIIVFQGTYSASNDFEIVNGADVLLKFNGGGSGATVTDVNVDLTVTGATIATADINGGAIDGTVIGAASAAAITATTITGTTITASTAVVPDASDGATLGSASLEWSDLYLADGAVVFFGDDQDITLTHVADTGLTLKHANTGDDKFPTFLLATGDTDIAANDKLGVINFQAPDEGAGTDAILVAAGIEAVSEGDFSASSNATSLVFKTGASEAAAEKMRIDSSGNVGIGTTSPSFAGFGSSTGGIDITNSANASLRLSGNAADAMFFVSGSAQHWLYGKGAVPMTFSTNGTERMRIDSSGNLSVGTTSAVTDSISLEQAFNLSWAESANSSYANVFRQRSSAATVLASGYKRSETSNKMDSSIAASWGKTAVWTGSESIRFYTDAASADAVGTDLTPTERMRIDSSGNVGVGTNTIAAEARMIVDGGRFYINSDDAFGLLLQNAGTNGGFIGTTAANILNFYNGSGTERMRIDSSGTVGIGTTSPSAKLSISNSISTTYSTTGYAATPSNSMLYLNNTNGGSDTASLINFRTGSGDGVVGFVEGGGTNDADFIIQTDGGSNGVERFRITNAGNVGIGTSAPQSLLQLNKTPPTAFGSPFLSVGFNTFTSSGMYTVAFGYEAVSGSIAPAEIGLVTTSDSSFTKGDLVFATRDVVTNTAPTERMRIASNGYLLIGTTTVPNGSADGIAFYPGSSGRILSGGSTGTFNQVLFYNPNGSVGSIQTSGSATAYNTSSDVRLKENIADAPAGNIDSIRVRSFDWKADGSHQTYGMVAQELVDVAPEAVSQGETEDDMWAVDYSKLVPMMIKEIQDLKAEVAALKGA